MIIFLKFTQYDTPQSGPIVEHKLNSTVRLSTILNKVNSIMTIISIKKSNQKY